jgi:hypothetical protein
LAPANWLPRKIRPLSQLPLEIDTFSRHTLLEKIRLPPTVVFTGYTVNHSAIIDEKNISSFVVVGVKSRIVIETGSFVILAIPTVSYRHSSYGQCMKILHGMVFSRIRLHVSSLQPLTILLSPPDLPSPLPTNDLCLLAPFFIARE